MSPPIAKEKTSKGPANRLALQPSTPALGIGAGEEALMLEGSTRNQAIPWLLSRQARGGPADKRPGNPPVQETERIHMQARAAAPGLSWNFSEIPVFAPDRRSRSQGLPRSTALKLPAVHQSSTAIGLVDIPPDRADDRVAGEVMGIANEVPRLAGHRFIQPKLIIGAVNDPFEQEADRVADAVVRTASPGSPGDPNLARHDVVQRACTECRQVQDQDETVWRKSDGHDGEGWSSVLPTLHAGLDRSIVQREIGKDEIQEQLIHAYLSDTDTEVMQRQADGQAGQQTDGQADEEEIAAGEQILMQAKPVGAQPVQPSSDLESATQSLEGGGDPLPSNVRDYMEPRFGHDFGSVRVHADSRAAEMARLANARAFTIGRNVVFGSGEYAPEGSDAGRRLLAHELTHVIQQGQAGPRLQRKIVVGGKPYPPSAKYLAYLDANFGPAMKEFVERMHNGGNPPTFTFSSYEQMGNEVRVRANAIKGIEEVHKGCCNYYDSAHPPHLDSTYWDQVGSDVDFKLKSPLPGGKQPSDAIESIFAPGAGTRLECFSMTIAIEYYSMLKGLGAAKFNAKFPAGIEISADGTGGALLQGASKKYNVVAVASKSELLPGDWVYFQNFKDYLVKQPGGYWQGENAIYLGGGQYRGFGVAALSETDLNQELVKQYNSGASPPPPLRTVADLLADGGGLLLNPVVRPIISTVAP